MNYSGEPLVFPSGTIVELHMHGDDVFRGRPELSHAFGAAIANWSWAEHWYSNIRVMLELNDPEFDLSNFEVVRTTPPEKKFLDKAMEKLGDNLRTELLRTAINLASKPAEARNALAHGILAYCPLQQDFLIVFKQESLRRAFRSGLAHILSRGSFENLAGDQIETAYRTFLQSGTRWTLLHLKNLSSASLHSAEILRMCCNLCSREASVRDSAEVMLKAQLKIAETRAR